MRTAAVTTLAMLLLAGTLPVASSIASPVVLTISGPQYALVGAPVAFAGSHIVRAGVNVPIPTMEVELFVDGVARGTDSATTGSYSIAHTFGARGAYTVFAVADAGAPTTRRSADLVVTAAQPPGPAQDVAAEPLAGSLSARVSWAAPADNGGAPIQQYNVQRRENGGVWLHRGVAPASASSFVDGGLVIGRAYDYRVIVVTPAALSAPAEAPLEGSAPLPPTLVATPIDRSERVAITAVGTGGPTQVIRLQVSYAPGSWTTFADLTGAAVSYSHDAWPAGHPTYRAIARSVVGDSAPTDAPVTGALPNAPTNVQVAISDHLSITWQAPASGGALQGYKVMQDAEWLDTLGHGATSLTWWNTDPGAHTISVIPFNAAGEGAAGTASFSLAQASAPALTGSVTELDNGGRVQLSWSPSTSDGGAPIVGYAVFRTPGGWNWDGTPQGRAGVAWYEPGDALSFSEDIMRSGETFTYEVAAFTVAGEGAASTYVATMPTIVWTYTHQLARFVACEGTTCTNVPAGGTYDRAGTGAVSYRAVYEGTVQRNGVPAAGKGVFLTIWEESDPEQENAESHLETTNAAGAYTATWGRATSITPGACTLIGFQSNLHAAALGTLDRFTVCP